MNYLLIIYIIIIYRVSSSLEARNKVCSLSIKYDISSNSPLTLKNSVSKLKLLVPDDSGNIILSKKDNILLTCPDDKNFIEMTKSNLTTAQCIEGDTFQIKKENVRFKDIKCKKIIRGQFRVTNKSCANDLGIISYIGYYLTNNFHSNLIEVCHDPFSGNTFYSVHFLQGQFIKSASNTQIRPNFGTQGLNSSRTSIPEAYKQVNQISTFKHLLKLESAASTYINSNSYLSRGHLSPDADFLYPATQFSTYYYINTAPQWQVINGGNWKRVESLVRKTARNLNDTLKVITGTYGILELPDYNNNLVKIYLSSDKQVSVPEYIWKIVYDQQKREAIVIIVLNNPFVKEVTKNELLCENICDDFGWSSKSWVNYNQGFVYCCEYGRFASVVNFVPKIRVSNVLRAYKK